MKFESSQRSHFQESRRSLTSAFCISINWLSPLSRSPSFTKNHSKPYHFDGKNAGNAGSISLLPTNEGVFSCR